MLIEVHMRIFSYFFTISNIFFFFRLVHESFSSLTIFVLFSSYKEESFTANCYLETDLYIFSSALRTYHSYNTIFYKKKNLIRIYD